MSSGEGPVTVRGREAGFCLGWKLVTGEGKTCGVPPTHLPVAFS